MARPAPCCALIAAATSSQGSALRDEITTLAPCSAMRSAIALPMPREEPVMTATLPSSENSDIALLLSGLVLVKTVFSKPIAKWG